MPVTGLENNGQPVTPKGFDSPYGPSYNLFLTLDAVAVNGNFTSLKATLWADPGSNDGSATVSQNHDPAFSNGNGHDIALATGTMVSASFNFDPTTNIRTADFVESMKPTLAGRLLLGGSIQPGTTMEEKLTTPPSVFHSNGVVGPGMINWVTGGDAVVTFDHPDTILLPNIPSIALLGDGGPSFLHHG
jgi:hypothetical protein